MKAYAYEKKGIVNASVEFDEITLRPTYRLLVGIPGRSNAFAIATRLGLPKHILEDAQKRLHIGETKIDTLVATLEENQRIAEKERLEAEQLLASLKKKEEQLEREKEELEKEKDLILARIEEEAIAAVNKSKKEAERILAELRQMALEEQAGIKEHRLIAAKKQLEETTPQLRKKKEPKKASMNQPIQVGDYVRVLSLNQKGEVIEQLNQNEFLVQLGIMKMTVARKNMEKVQSPNQTVAPPPRTRLNTSRSPMKMELDIRGKNIEDSILLIDKYLDDAIINGLHRVSIIHGKGTGVLGLGVQKYLKSHPLVKSLRYGGEGEGGLGATIVELK